MKAEFILFISYFAAVQCVNYLRPFPDPFLTNPEYQCTPTQEKYIADPDFCDRFLLCHKGRFVAMYCPKGKVYSDGGCYDLFHGEQYCRSRGAANYETPAKPEATCHPYSPKQYESVEIQLQPDGSYYKKATIDHAYHFCNKGDTSAYTFECIHPEEPEAIIDSKDTIRCFPKGSIRQQMIQKTQGNLASRKHVGFKPKPSVSYNGLPIRFIKNRPRCPKIPAVKAHFDFTDASRFMHNSDCIHFWTCSTDNTPRLHSCPHAQVFDPDSERCIFYKHASNLCNKVFDYESSEKLAVYERLYGLQHQVQESQSILSAKRQTEIMKATISEIQTHGALLRTLKPGTTEFKRGIAKAIALKNRLKVLKTAEEEDTNAHSRAKRSFNLIMTHSPVHIEYNTEYYYHVFENIFADENGILRCPASILREGVTIEDVEEALKSPHFNAHNFYDMNSFRFGSATLYPNAKDCNHYYICGPWEHASQDNRPSIGGCSFGQVFQPLKIKPYNSLFQFAFVPGTGRCVDPDKVDVESCKRYVPHEQEQEKEESSYSLDPFPTMIDAVIATEEANEKAVEEYMAQLLEEINEDVRHQDSEYDDEEESDDNPLFSFFESSDNPPQPELAQ